MVVTRQAATGTVVRVPVPKGRDPFVNTPLLSLGPGADGAERFWISTWNSNVGCTAALVTEAGDARIYRFPKHGGFYSAVQEDADTLWLCGWLTYVVRLSLSTGTYDQYPTGAPGALVFQGMVLDQATGKLFAAASPMTKTTAFSFDIRRRAPAAVHEIDTPAHYARCSFPNGDGSYSLVMHCVGESLVRWDPRAETVCWMPYQDQLDTEALNEGTTCKLIADDAGRRYFPRLGWFNPAAQAFEPGPVPEREMTWFARRGGWAWGANGEGGNLTVARWELATGTVRDLCRIPDSQLYNVNLTAGGTVVAVTLFGTFLRFHGETGALEMIRRLDTDSYGHIDCLRRIDADRLLGTSFITQRFWQVNLRTGEGMDCGRACPGFGEVLQTWRLGGKIYLAAYTGAELVEYDPDVHPHFPENPRVVADPPHGMRPVAAADDGRHLYYACSTAYGTLGAAVAKYDTKTGACTYALRPLGDQQIVSLRYDTGTRSLLCGTTMHADCRSCPPTDDRCYFAVLDPDTLQPRAQLAAPAGTEVARLYGPLGGGRYLAGCEGPNGCCCFTLDAAHVAVPDAGALVPQPNGTRGIQPAHRAGLFVLHRGRRLELWDFRRRPRRLRVLVPRFTGYGYHVEGTAVYVKRPKEVVIYEDLLQ